MGTVSSAARAAALGHINVLVLDDDPRLSGIVKTVLKDLGFQRIFVGKDGKEGLRIMRETPIDLVVTDWQMEPMQGIEFIQYVRSNPDSPNRYVPIILLTGQAEAEDVEQARDTGVTEFVVKPFTVRRLTDRLIFLIENPRSFILTKAFKGPDRRRRKVAPKGDERRKRKHL